MYYWTERGRDQWKEEGRREGGWRRRGGIKGVRLPGMYITECIAIYNHALAIILPSPKEIVQHS